jgi:hypothetical protein
MPQFIINLGGIIDRVFNLRANNFAVALAQI